MTASTARGTWLLALVAGCGDGSQVSLTLEDAWMTSSGETTATTTTVATTGTTTDIPTSTGTSETTAVDPSSTGDAPTTSTGEPVSTTDVPPATCGNGVVEAGEACDDGDLDDSDACTVECAAPSCSDGLVSGDETDVDCGGGCPGCAAGQACAANDDCTSEQCDAGECAVGCVAWEKQWGGGGDDSGTDVAVLGADVVVAAYIASGNAGTVTRFTAAGDEVWTAELTTSGDDYVWGVATTAAGEVVAVGHTDGALPGNVALGLDDAFVAKFDGAGAPLWIRQFGGDMNESADAVTVDAAGNVIVVGRTRGALGMNPPAGAGDLFVAKFDPKGVKQWIRQLGTPGEDDANAVATDGAGDIYVVGRVDGPFDGNPSLGKADAYLLKYDATGVKQWSRQIGTAQSDQGAGVATDADGAVYIAGTIVGSLDGNQWGGFEDTFVSKYDGAGAKQWTRQFGGASDETAFDLATDGADHLVIGGTAFDDFDGRQSAGGSDLFVTRYDTSGAKQWTRLLGSATNELVGRVAALADGSVVVTGSTWGGFVGPSKGGDDVMVAHVCPQ